MVPRDGWVGCSDGRRSSAARSGSAVRSRHVGARESTRARCRPARAWCAPQARARDARVPARAGRARPRAAQDALSARCSGAAAATSCSARTSCSGIRTRSASATTSSSTTTACSTPKATAIAASTIGSGVFVGRNTILSCKNGDIDIDDGANIGFNCELFSASRVRIGRDTLVAAYCYLIGGDHDCLAIRRRRPGAEPAIGGYRRRRRRVAWRGRQDPRRRVDWRWRRGRRGRRRPRGGSGTVRSPSACRRASLARATKGQPSMSGAPGSTRKLNVLQVCDHLGWEGSRMHGVKRLFAWMIPRFDQRALQRFARQPAQEGSVRGNARLVWRRYHIPPPVEIRSGDVAGASEDHRSKEDRHPAPARLRRDDVRPAGGRACAESRRFCTSTRTSPTRRGSRRSPTAPRAADRHRHRSVAEHGRVRHQGSADPGGESEDRLPWRATRGVQPAAELRGDCGSAG